MSEKKLKQMRLPFSLLTSPGSDSSPKTAGERSSPKTPVVSRKRKPSSDGDNTRSNKIGRKDLKENIATEQGILEIKDSDEEAETNETFDEDVKVSNETTPNAENVLHIKLPSCSKSKRKINMDVKPPKSVDEEDDDDSVVYLDDEDVPKSCKKARKSVKKSEKKKKKASPDDANKAKKTLKLGSSVEEEAEGKDEVKVDDAPETIVLEISDGEETEKSDKVIKSATDRSKEDTKDGKTTEKVVEKLKNNNQIDIKKVSTTDNKAKPKTIEAPKSPKSSPKSSKTPSSSEKNPPNKDFDTIPSQASSPLAEDPEVIHEEIAEVLSDNSEASGTNTTSPHDDNNKTPSSGKIDISKLTPKQLARRKEQEARRMEKELLRQKERDMKELQRLKEKEEREEAKRKEKEEKEEARKKEKEERDRKRQVRKIH